MTAFGSELHGIVDEICNGFEQEVAISSNANFLLGVYHQGDVLVLCDRVVEIRDIAYQLGQFHIAESHETPAMFNLGNTEQCRDHRK